MLRVEQRARECAAAFDAYRFPVGNNLDRVTHACAGATARIGEKEVASIAVDRPAI
jgi:hypothetical protein